MRLLAQFMRHMQADRRSRVPYLSRRMAIDDRLLWAVDAGFRYVVLTGGVRDKAQADRLLKRYGLTDYRALALFLHEQRQRAYRPNYRQRMRQLVQRWLGIEQVDPERREWEVYLRDQRPTIGHFRHVRASKK
jgi:hypothetical protein